ncbi:MAG: hypothetical protein FWD38_01550 [Oscillospiraceae bacterium]|nr:hypothetical protein [Oscillospiraceae bacterium]
MQFITNYDEIILDDEFQKLLPPLAEKVFNDLEESLLQHGVRDSLVLWNGILIDGYNRYKIIGKHDLPFFTVKMEFSSRDEVIIWIINNQVSRRNLSPSQLRFFRGLHYNAEKRLISNKTGKNQYNEVGGQNDHQPQSEQFQGKTADNLASHYNVSSKTIRRDAQIANTINAIGELSPDTKADIISGKTRISNKQLQELSTASTEEIKDVISQIEDGTFENRKQGISKPNGGYKNDDSSIDSNKNGSSNINISSYSLTENTTNMQPWEITFTKMTEEFRTSIKTHPHPDNTTIKSALRQYIQMLEDLYSGI